MIDIFIISHFVLWTLLIVVSIALIILFKTVQNLKMAEKRNLVNEEEFLPRRDSGLPVGDLFPKLEIQTLENKTININQKGVLGSIVIFSSTTCSVCDEVYPDLTSFSKMNPELPVFLFSEGEKNELDKKIKDFEIDVPIHLITNDDLIKTKTNVFPFAYFLSPEGYVLSKGVINNAQGDLNILIKMADGNEGLAV
ncbi:TlpA family protein disulfide reductase [Evansella cellulosilytica]|uniref:Thioredoxin domain-containing protein n=1 Tax=Evansella cellulosilytica (strain ATCC 21833 / DSM 2522 / FERM P-1141 / JCM 9156 / N-4) TaxID=649639 RepID=E6TVJ9_EVAC2|nr:hypothetical protein [Evansella cellulosilytica]ADU31016.1 hypothetical protein Bcell_2761 [Evansella cellulosilytica DSM 2522]